MKSRLVVWTLAGLVIGLIIEGWLQRSRPLIQGDLLIIRPLAWGIVAFIAAAFLNRFQKK
jgi:hypothetical protein